jgi:hypothetical protein
MPVRGREGKRWRAKTVWAKRFLGDGEREPLMNAYGMLIERRSVNKLNTGLHQSCQSATMRLVRMAR